jgi:hypothetical protein
MFGFEADMQELEPCTRMILLEVMSEKHVELPVPLSPFFNLSSTIR